MKKVLKINGLKAYHIKYGERVEGPNPDLTGDTSQIYGNTTHIIGDATGLRGDCSGLSGDCSGLWGNLDNAGLTDEDRARGVHIETLIAEDE